MAPIVPNSAVTKSGFADAHIQGLATTLAEGRGVDSKRRQEFGVLVRGCHQWWVDLLWLQCIWTQMRGLQQPAINAVGDRVSGRRFVVRRAPITVDNRGQAS